MQIIVVFVKWNCKVEAEIHRFSITSDLKGQRVRVSVARMNNFRDAELAAEPFRRDFST